MVKTPEKFKERYEMNGKYIHQMSVGGYTATIEQHGKDYTAFIKEMQGVNTQGARVEETRDNLLEAFQLVQEVNR